MVTKDSANIVNARDGVLSDCCILCFTNEQSPDAVHQGFGMGSLAVTYFHMGNPHYHRRKVVSRSCSGWEGVGPTRYGRQTKRVLESRYVKCLSTVSQVSLFVSRILCASLKLKSTGNDVYIM